MWEREGTVTTLFAGTHGVAPWGERALSVGEIEILGTNADSDAN